MFRPKSQQPSADDLSVLLPQAKQERLECQWPGVFRREILPMLLAAEDDFADLYHSSFGAPNKPVAALLGILILKEFHDYTDEQTLEAVEFNLQWQYALLPVRRTQTGQLGFSEASISQKTLHNFRDRLFQNQKHQTLFHHLTGRIIERFGLDTSPQRMDSTQVVGAMKQLTRLGLFVKTIEAFLFKLNRMAKKDAKIALVLEQLPQKFHQRYLDREGYFSHTRSSLACRRLDRVAQDLWELIYRFRRQEKLSKLKQYRHMKRLFKEQCDFLAQQEDTRSQPIEVSQVKADIKGKPFPAKSTFESTADTTDTPKMCAAEKGDASTQDNLPKAKGEEASKGSDPQVGLKDSKQIASTSLQSPSDPDATFLPVRCTQTGGYKGKGYQLQLVETCAGGNPFQVITTCLLQGAHESDQNAALLLLETLDEQGNKPKVAFADSNYISGENIVEAHAMGVDLQGPLPGSPPTPSKLTLSDFTFSPAGQHVLSCPAGSSPKRHQDTRDKTGRCAYFDKTVCDQCPLTTACPTHPNHKERRLRWTAAQLATARRRQEQETTPFKENYKIRSGIEASISEEKNSHGLGNLRVRGRPAVELVATFKTLAVNVKRAVKYVLKTAKNLPKAAQEGIICYLSRKCTQIRRVCTLWKRLQASKN